MALDALATAFAATLLTLGFFLVYERAMGEPWALGGDNFINQFPLTFEAWQSWTQGRVPAWTTRIWSGYPVLADMTGGPLYPPLLLTFALTPAPHLFAYDLATAMHAGIFAGGGTFLLRLWGTGRAAAFLGGALLLVAPFSHQWATHILPPYAALAWWPWLLAAAEQLRRPGTSLVGAFAWLGWIAIASQVLAGYPEFAFYSGLLAGTWILILAEGRSLPQRLWITVALGLGGLALASPQLIPSAYVLSQSMRGALPSPLLEEAMSVTWDTWLLPVLGPGVAEPLFPTFLGYASLALAALALWRQGPRAWLLGVLAATSFLLATGPRTPLYPALHALPVFEIFRGPVKFWQITEVTITLLAALGADVLLRDLRSKPRRAAILAVLMIVAALAERAAFTAVRFQHYAGVRAAVSDRPLDVLREVEESGLMERATLAGPAHRTLFVAHPELFFGQINVVFGVDSLRGGPAQLLGRNHGRALRAALRPGLLERAGVRFVLATTRACDQLAARPELEVIETSPGLCLLEHTKSSPLYQVLPGATALASASEAAERMRADATQPVGVVLDQNRPDLLQGSEGSVAVREEGPGTVRLDVRTDGPALLFVRQSWAPGWTARVDGVAAPIYQADGPFFAVELPGGNASVELLYRAQGFGLGVALALTWAFVATWIRLRRR